MNKIQMALALLPQLSVLYESGVIDIAPSLYGQGYIQLTEELFTKLFPDCEVEEDGRYRFNLNGVLIIAVAHG